MTYHVKKMMKPQWRFRIQTTTSDSTSFISCSALLICSGVPMSSTNRVGEFGSASISLVTWILAPDWSWRYLIVSPPLPIMTPTLPFGISIFLLEPWYAYEIGIAAGAPPRWELDSRGFWPRSAFTQHAQLTKTRTYPTQSQSTLLKMLELNQAYYTW